LQKARYQRAPGAAQHLVHHSDRGSQYYSTRHTERPKAAKLGPLASREWLELAQIRAEDRVLEIGAGLAGPARLLASALGCRVDCLELSPDFCAGALLLKPGEVARLFFE
jgi:cyclopropane fatty-acyl-phospholipid synthase-like methyltransferase